MNVYNNYNFDYKNIFIEPTKLDEEIKGNTHTHPLPVVTRVDKLKQ